jgi:hypothetical protein
MAECFAMSACKSWSRNINNWVARYLIDPTGEVISATLGGQ